ncbi:MAG TPA: hypothetical protein VMS02_08405 [Solirubrobacteraceae bacterium]|nr:hypothetical protein [Solirubrobacteraceae bacterium]
MAEENDVRITQWPANDRALLSHAFEDTPAHVVVSSEERFDVDMDMRVSAREPFPVCIKLCEPICVESQYTIGIEIFDRPFASITVRGRTRLASCNEDEGGASDVAA